MRPFRQRISDQDKQSKTPFSVHMKKFLRTIGRWLFLLLCALGTAALVVVSYPKYSHSFLAWLALAPFVWGITKTRGFWSSFFYSWLTGILFNAGVFYWIYYTCLHGGGLSQGLSLAAWLGLSGLLALQFACFGGSCFYLRNSKGYFPLLAACGFVTWEWLHQLLAFYGLGFPWLMLGYTQWNAPEFIQLASFTGVYGVSFIVAFTGASIGWAFAEHSIKRATTHMLLAAAVFLGTFMYGHFFLPDEKDPSSRQSLLSLSTAVLQPNIDQYKKWNETFEKEILDTITSMGNELEGKGVMLAVWPESTVPGTLTEEKYKQLFAGISARSGAHQLIGSNIPQATWQYVGSYLMSPEQEKLQDYRKVKLVPFGEYIPLEDFVKSLFPDVAILGELGSFTPGNRGQNLLNLAGVPLGSTICYESIFPQLWLAQNRQGAKLFVNSTNDAWFFDTAAPYQHLAVNVLRAAETSRPVLRAANTGFSAVIDSYGRITQKTDLFTRDTLFASVPLSTGDSVNFYTQWGEWFAWVCAILYFTLLISLMVFFYE